MVLLSPFVYWAQTENKISLQIDLKNVAEPNINVTEDKISFLAQGTGAHGNTNYGFNLDFYNKVETNADNAAKPLVQVFENRVVINLMKINSAWWPRLTAQPQKPAWLKINFDLWQSEETLEDSEDEKRDVMKDYPGMYDKLHKEEMGYRKEDFKKVYLILYNLFQFVGFTYVVCVMSIRFSKLGHSSVTSMYEHVGSAMKFIQLLQFLEVMHPLFGYTKGGFIIPLIQVGIRNFILFGLIDAEPRLQTKPVVCYLFYIWCSIETIRYPFYITQVYKKEVYLITWLRYTIWIPLYPLGILCESVVVFRSIPYFEETQRYSASMPNDWNFTLNVPTLLRIHLLLLSIPGLYTMMNHMYRLRVKKLKSKINYIRKSR